MKCLYFDCFAGISGDMTLGALLDLGLDKELFLKELDKLKLDGYEIELSKSMKNGIQGTDVNVMLTCDHKHKHHHHNEDDHHHRNLEDIEKIIDESLLNSYVKGLSKRIFNRVAKAEAKVHGTTIDRIHFHEVGAVDSIVDIVGTAICIDMLNVDRIMSSSLHDGVGFVKCQHGYIPVPAPATVEILKNGEVPFYSTGIENEMVTPTGAAIIAELADSFGNRPEMVIKRIGYGSGKRDMEIPNCLRVTLGEMQYNFTDTAIVLECNIDDMSGEISGYVMGKLFENGAFDVFFTPIYMKKNRPGVKLSVICDDNEANKLEEIVLKETTTIGIRRYKVERKCMEREKVNIKIHGGTVKVKVSNIDGIKKHSPEYEDCKKIAETTGLTLKEVFKLVDSRLDSY
jgi:uncharacterized protein (TIGR00299 family) protein